jgi:hypothetical protein
MNSKYFLDGLLLNTIGLILKTHENHKFLRLTLYCKIVTHQSEKFDLIGLFGPFLSSRLQSPFTNLKSMPQLSTWSFERAILDGLPTEVDLVEGHPEKAFTVRNTQKLIRCGH